MRYRPVYSNKEKVVTMSSTINNAGEIDSASLKKDGVDVLTYSSLANSKDDDSSKVVSVGLINQMFKEFNGSNNPLVNSSLISDIQSLTNERNEIYSKTDVLLDFNLTPEFNYSSYRPQLIESLGVYSNIYETLKEYITELINMEINDSSPIDEYVDKFNSLLSIYCEAANDANRLIQLSNQSVMDVKMDKAIKIANENIEQVVDKLSYKMIITSDTGPFFRNGMLDTYLRVKVMKEDVEVTSNYSELQFRWKRESSNENKDDIWSMNARRGTSLHITNADYEPGGCSFICSLYDEAGRMIASTKG